MLKWLKQANLKDLGHSEGIFTFFMFLNLMRASRTTRVVLGSLTSLLEIPELSNICLNS